MNRSEFDRMAQQAQEEERRSLVVLGALVCALLAGLLGVTLVQWFDAGAQQLAQAHRVERCK